MSAPYVPNLARPRPGVVREIEDFYQHGASALGLKSNMAGIIAMLESGAPGRGSPGRNLVEDMFAARSDGGQSDTARRVRHALLDMLPRERRIIELAHFVQPPASKDATSALGRVAWVALLTSPAAELREQTAGMTTARAGRAVDEWFARVCRNDANAETLATVRAEAEAMLQGAYDAYFVEATRNRTPAGRSGIHRAAYDAARKRAERAIAKIVDMPDPKEIA